MDFKALFNRFTDSPEARGENLLKLLSQPSPDPVRALELLQKDVKCKDSLGCHNPNAFIKAAYHGFTDVVMAMLDKQVAHINDQDSSGTTALIAAASYNRKELVAFLLSCRAQVDVCDASLKTALHYAHEGGAADIVAALQKADSRTARNYADEIPLHSAPPEKPAKVFTV